MHSMNARRHWLFGGLLLALAPACDSSPPAATPDAAMLADAGLDGGVRTVPYPDASFGGTTTDVGRFDAPVPSASVGDPCTSDLECLAGRCRRPALTGVASTCAWECDPMTPCPAGERCGADGLCALDNPLGGVCATGQYDGNGDPADGCEYACAGRADYPDSCNAIDDDCDTRIDEAAIGVGGSCEVLGCGTGTFQCLDGLVRCVGEGAGSVPESCDGLDNDCDGVADEGCAARIVLDGAPRDGPVAGPGGGVDVTMNCPAERPLIQYLSGTYADRLDELQQICRPWEMRNSGDPRFRVAVSVEPPVGQRMGRHTDANAFGLETPGGQLLVGATVRYDDAEIWGIQPLYQPMQAFQREPRFRRGGLGDLGYHGNPRGGTAVELRCNEDELVVGFYGRIAGSPTIRRLGLRCQRYHLELIAGP